MGGRSAMRLSTSILWIILVIEVSLSSGNTPFKGIEPGRMKLSTYKNAPTGRYAYPYGSYYNHPSPTRTTAVMPVHRAEDARPVVPGPNRRSGIRRKGIGAAIVAALSGK